MKTFQKITMAPANSILVIVDVENEFCKPGGAFYLYPEAPGGSGRAFAERAVAEEKLLVVPGSVFGAADTHFRIAYTVDDRTLDRGIAALTRLAGPG